MSLQNTNLLVQIAPIPATFKGDLNAFVTELVRRMKIVSPSGINFIAVGDTEPSSNVGPWLKNGTKWYVWDPAVKKYVPLDISDSEMHWFQVGATVPATANPPIWLQTTANATQAEPQYGTPIGWRLFDGTNWVPIDEVLDKSITLAKTADGVPNALLTWGADLRPVLFLLGSAGQFLRVNSAGTAFEWADIASSQLNGLLSSQIVGPLTDSGYSATVQTAPLTLTTAREVFIYAYGNTSIPNTSNALVVLNVDGTDRDSVRISDAALSGGNTSCTSTLMCRLSLGAGPHNLVLRVDAPGIFVAPADNGGRLPVKFVIQLL